MTSHVLSRFFVTFRRWQSGIGDCGAHAQVRRVPDPSPRSACTPCLRVKPLNEGDNCTPSSRWMCRPTTLLPWLVVASATSALTPSNARPAHGRRFSVFTSTTGTCTIVGNCVRSPNYHGNYENSDACTITMAADTLLSVTAFKVEYSSSCAYDYVRVRVSPATSGSTKYCGVGGPSDGPNGVVAMASYGITWSTDYSLAKTGWEICGVANESPPPSPPPPSPSPPPSSPSSLTSVTAADAPRSAARRRRPPPCGHVFASC